jgi:hypothetical protein
LLQVVGDEHGDDEAVDGDDTRHDDRDDVCAESMVRMEPKTEEGCMW